MTPYSEQILFTGDASVQKRPLSRPCCIIITTYRVFLIPKRHWHSWGKKDFQYCNIEDIDPIRSMTNELKLDSPKFSCIIRGDNIEAMDTILREQKRVLAIDQIPKTQREINECLLMFRELFVDQEKAPFLLTHRLLMIGGKHPLTAEIGELKEPRQNDNAILLEIEGQVRRIHGDAIEALFVLLVVLREGRFPLSAPREGRLNNAAALFVQCREGLSIRTHKQYWLPFNRLVSIQSTDQDNLTVSYEQENSLNHHTLSYPQIKRVCHNGFLKSKQIETESKWADSAIFFESEEKLVFGCLSYEKEDLIWSPRNQSEGWRYRGSLCGKEQGDDNLLRLLTPAGSLQFDISTGRTGQTNLWLLIEDDKEKRPSSPIADFVNLRASVRLKIQKKTYATLLNTKNTDSDVKQEEKWPCELLDLSFDGCALGMNPPPNSLKSLEEESLLEIIIPIEEKKISVKGIISHMVKTTNARQSHRYGIRFIQLNPSIEHELFNETLRLARSHLIKMES